MKRSLSMSTLLILPLCFPLCACAGKPYTFVDPIEYTAENPICEYVPDDFKWGCYGFNKLKNYYAENYIGSQLCLFDTDDNTYIGPSTDCRVCDNDGIVYVYEFFYWRDDELGLPQNNKQSSGGFGGIPPHSFSGEIVIMPLKAELNKSKLTFEFGKVDLTQEHLAYKYANIFANGECFATFIYTPNVPITQEWFENFLTENLVWGDSLVYEETDNFGGEE